MGQEYGIIFAVANFFCMIYALIVYWKTNDDIGSEREIFYFKRFLVAYIVFTLTEAIWAFGNFDIFDIPIPVLLVISALTMISVSFLAFYWFAYGEARMGFSFRETRWVNFVVLIPLVTVTVFYLVSITSGLMFSYNEEGRFVHGPLYNIGALFSEIYLIFVSVHAFIMLVREESSAARQQYLMLLGFIALPTVAVVFDTLVPSTPIVALALFSSILLVFSNVQESQIFNDALTGLNNRRRSDQYLEELIAQTSEENPFYLFMIDADNFKVINDSYGHIEGDRALVTMAHALRNVGQVVQGFVARYGGDEFIIVADEESVSDPESIVAEVERCIVDASKAEHLDYSLDATVGWVRCDNAKMKRDVVIRAADAMLYERKQRHKAMRQSA